LPAKRTPSEHHRTKWFVANDDKDKTSAALSNSSPQGCPVLRFDQVAYELVSRRYRVTNQHRAAGRSRVRGSGQPQPTAIGAGRARIIRQLLIESIVLSLAGGFAGWLLALAGLHWFDASIAGFPKPLWLDLSMNPKVFVYLAAISVGTGILFGLAPALELAKVDVSSAMKNGGHGAAGGTRGRRLSSMLVVLEMALCVVLLVGAGLMIRSAVKLYGTPIGVNAANVLTMRIDLPEAKYPRPPDEISFHQRLKTRIESLPGVESASIGFPLPLDAYDWSRTIVPEGFVPNAGNERGYNVGTSTVAPGYFKTMGTRLVAGRDFTEFDTLSKDRVAIVNQALAQKFWPNEDPTGKRIRLGLNQGPLATVIGVAETGKYMTLGESPMPYVFLAALQDFPEQATIVVRTRVTPASMIEPVREGIRKTNPILAVQGIQTIDEFRDRLLGVTDMLAEMLGGFGVVALVLAGIGLYGVINFSVAQRSREIAIRVAIGAKGQDVMRMIIRQSMSVVLLGTVIGLAAGIGFAYLMMSLLYGVSAADIPTLAAASFLVVSVGTVAAYIPARRASRADPLTTLRAE